jgi:YidC/Oxa1 family membrane protein insertase
MNKNLVTFMVLSILVYVGSIWLTNRMYPHLAEDKAKAFADAMAAKGGAGTNAKGGSPAISPASLAVEKAKGSQGALKVSSPASAAKESLTRVSTNAAESVVSNMGAKIQSLKLLAYREHPESPDPVQLIAGEGHYGALSLTGGSLQDDAWIQETAKPLAQADGSQQLVYSYPVSGTGITFRKTFVFDKDDFVIHIKVDVVNSGKDDLTVGKSYLLWGPGIGMPEQGRQAAASAGGAAMVAGSLERVSAGDPRVVDYVSPKWLAIKNHYFVAAYINDGDFPEAQLRCETLDGVTKTVSAALGLGPFTVKAGETKTFSTRLYAGPQDYAVLESFHNNLNHVVQFSYRWLSVLSVFLLSVMKFFHGFTHNWGFAVILLTLFVKLALFYPTHRGMASSRRMQTQMAKMAPVLESLKKTYKDDAAKLQQETMRLYKEHGVNPLSGCFLMLPQMFIMISLYGALNGAFELRGASFLGPWTDLSAPDPTYILVPLMGLSMWLQQKMAPTNTAAASEDQAQMQKMMTTMMPIMFTVMGFIFRWPTGLLLYWSVSNVFGIGQQWYVNKTVK